MVSKYPEYKNLNLPQIGKEILDWWEKEKIFEKSVSTREGAEPFVFYEGPPSANGMPGIHHVMARAIKDIFCRYQTLKGKQVKRKAGWDTHGLPIELAIEKTLGITKEDIGKKISIEDYNKACRKEVMKYQDKWEEVTRMMGYWVDMKHPYVTYENNYIESVWWLLKELYNKKLLYKGYTIQPYSPAAGTGLSTHELNQPGCYRNVRDTTAVAMFKVSENSKDILEELIKGCGERFGPNDIYLLAWTTTPWTLPSNTALAVGTKIDYVAVKTVNQYSKKEAVVILASALRDKYFGDGKSKLPVGEDVATFKGKDLEGISYEQLLPFAQPKDGEAFKVVCGDFVTTEDGTGIVHIAPSFGADDFRVAKQNGIGSLTLVDRRGKFLPEVKDDIFLYGDEYVKAEYLSDEEKKIEFQKQKKILEAKRKIKELKEYLSVDERIVLKLQEEGKLFKKEKYEHTYPHCWRTDKPILYYPLDSWFVKVTAMKDRMIELNKTINWKPEHTGTGRFGEWLNNLQDWNLSRSRFWGIPLPIWRESPFPTLPDGKGEEICIGSVEELRKEIDKSVALGFMKDNPLRKKDFDLHKPYADEIILASSKGKKMFREADLIDVWFDSGAMPYAQHHFPFENKNLFPLPFGEGKGGASFPADFIAEGVDQTRGWFYTLHAIAALCFDSVAYKNVVSNGLVLDKNGNKMSKRLGNAADPFSTLEKYGPDAVRWYMVTNADPWDNLKFDLEGVAEKQRSFFGTLYNTYAFFALYANIDNFAFVEKEIPLKNKSEIDRWILSELNSLVKVVDESYSSYEPTKAGRAIETFVDEHLSNWYVRLSRRRFWKGDYSQDKISAYQTLYRCLEVVAQLASPIAPFFSDKLFKDLNDVTKKQNSESVHLSIFPKADETVIDKPLEERMEMAQKISSMILSIRKKENIRVRQPLNKIQIPVLDESNKKKIEAVKDLILSEVNVKAIEFVDESTTLIVKSLKLNFKTLGKKCGKDMKEVQQYANANAPEIISSIEKTGKIDIGINGANYTLQNEDVEIIPVDIPGWKVANSGSLTVALDITITPQLREEGIAREIVNRIQNLRKENKFEVTDRIDVRVKNHPKINSAIINNLDYIRAEILANAFEIVNEINGNGVEIEVDDEIKTMVAIDRIKQLN
ncbi:MAG: isoleucine--tRNA ligase [Bacteroidetes bacterium]|nr:isoleucine--tRNA ligase [Bacteroidota bacterium]